MLGKIGQDFRVQRTGEWRVSLLAEGPAEQIYGSRKTQKILQQQFNQKYRGIFS